ncbi:UvrD-helicase domain-containing protein [Actinophytocola sediminis]
MTTTYQPTPEQQAVIDACRSGGNLVVEAAAGAGKTSTLRLAAAEMPGRILYVAYNKAAANEAAASFPAHARCSTVHALAFGAVGRTYARRLKLPRQTNTETARRLGVRDHVEIGQHLALTPAHVTRLALATVQRFCQSADDELAEKHLPQLPGTPSVAELARWHAQIPLLRGSGEHQVAGELLAAWEDGLRARRDLAAAVLPVARRAWADLRDPEGRAVRFEHDHYLKMWQLTRPRLSYDVVMLDEAQDSNPVTADVVTSQQGQRVAIGDGCQQLYAWRGAVDALATWPSDVRLFLTQSWRFGEAVAREANKWLSILDTPMRVRGNPSLPTTIGVLSEPDAVLCRSNAGAVARVIAALDAGRRPALVGGAGELVRLAEAAEELQAGRRTSHPELFTFESWRQVQEYVEEGGSDLKPFVDLVDKYRPAKIINSLSRTVSEDQADVIVSTAHKSKGREWPRVEIADDFHEPKPDADGSPGQVPRADAMLAYVAVTRAKLALDRTGLAWVDRYVPVAGLGGAA